MSDLALTRIAAARSRRHPEDLLRAMLASARLMLVRSRERQVLASLDARALHDIGITPHEAGAESSKPFWRA